MSKSKAELENALRTEILTVCREALSKYFDLDPVKQIENISVGEITLPLCDEEGNEKWPVLKVSIPRGARNGEGGYIPYDGHAAAEDYRLDCEDRAAKKAASAAKKEAEEKARAAKREAKKIVKELNEKGLDKMIHEGAD